MSRNIIMLFNNHYQQYLNNFDKNLIIRSFIDKYFISLNKNIQYEILNNHINPSNTSNTSNNDIIIELNFNNQNVGYLKINEQIVDINFNLFINYLSILIYNTKYTNITESINHTIFTEIIDMINDGVIVCDNQYNIHTINVIAKNMISVLNIYNVDFINMKIFNIFSQLEDILNLNEIYRNKKISYKIEKNNNKINLLLTINTIIYNELYYYIIILNHNIINNQLNNDGLLSHELRNPLQTITFANHLIQKKFVDIDINLLKYLNIIDKSVDDMIKIINDILDIDRLDSNKLDLKFELINIHYLIEDIKFDFTKHINNPLIKFNIILNENLNKINYCFYTDTTRIKQILMNILDNSIKYSKINTENIITLDITYSNDSNHINFSITDTGIGIKDNINIFDRNLIIQNNIKCNSNGFGLYICNKLANLLGGYIKINSLYKSGTQFIFSHPIKIINNINNQKKNLEILNNNPKILLVDDNDNIILLFKDILENIKFKYELSNDLLIDCCNSKDLILELVKINNYDIIFLDINSDNINGMTFAKLIRRNSFNNKIIAITYNLDGSLDKSLFDGILIKPFSENDIIDKLKLI